MRKLSILKVDQNRLVELPPTIGDCVMITELMLTENQLTRIPPTIGKLSSLTTFNLDRNKLQELPSEVSFKILALQAVLPLILQYFCATHYQI